MVKRILLLIVFLIVSTSCDNKENNIDDDLTDDTSEQETLLDEDDETDLSFDYSIESSAITGTVSRDIVSCGNSIAGGGEDGNKAFVFKMKDNLILWQYELDNYYIQSINSVACDVETGAIYAGGDRANEGETKLSGFIIAINSDGKLLWEKEIDKSASSEVYALSVTDSGDVIGGGRINYGDEEESANQTDAFVFKYSKSGGKLFFTTFGTPSFDTVQTITEGSDKFVFAGGHSAGDMEKNLEKNNSETGIAGFIVKVKPEGDIHWKKNVPLNNVWKVSGKKTGKIYISGSKVDGGFRSGAVLQSSLDGKVEYIYKFDTYKGTEVTGIDIDDKENIYISGYYASDKENPINNNELFLKVFDITSRKENFSLFYGSDDLDINPKIAVDNLYNPFVVHYAVKETEERYITMTRFVNN
jgi:hypothetical protein